jgi:hypothetical protein
MQLFLYFYNTKPFFIVEEDEENEFRIKLLLSKYY